MGGACCVQGLGPARFQLACWQKVRTATHGQGDGWTQSTGWRLGTFPLAASCHTQIGAGCVARDAEPEAMARVCSLLLFDQLTLTLSISLCQCATQPALQVWPLVACIHCKALRLLRMGQCGQPSTMLPCFITLPSVLHVSFCLPWSEIYCQRCLGVLHTLCLLALSSSAGFVNACMRVGGRTLAAAATAALGCVPASRLPCVPASVFSCMHFCCPGSVRARGVHLLYLCSLSQGVGAVVAAMHAQHAVQGHSSSLVA